ncbi:hypothetical protein BO82DRAFT_52049 [Aspergillus uvarum CBS 121591]|uniref:Uncharacterized protein n=1 Tax=Aspergillus uvarum CBS 121591 TaxID=1448315 RepID=A0A319CMX0_9EURO|nr:hypothetical protein BO82DRAFT_52049 [Aspergillus uvarum CBS 121591]PYH86826.1 hypothetical protein BO82DRAFT_52049 [Aspergillus uvarum CBS 121591]
MRSPHHSGIIGKYCRQWPVVTIPTIELWGRRRILMVCALAQGVYYLLATVLLRFSDENGGANKHVYGSAAATFFFCILRLLWPWFSRHRMVTPGRAYLKAGSSRVRVLVRQAHTSTVTISRAIICLLKSK